MPCLNNSIRSSRGRIYINWLLFCFTLLFLASCSSHSVRTGLSPLSQYKHKIDESGKAKPMELPSEFLEIVKSTEPQVQNSGLQGEISEANLDNSQLISLDTKLRPVENNNYKPDGNISGIQSDIADLRHSIEEIKDAIRFYHEGEKDAALAGPEDLTEQSIKETYLENTGDEFIILSDEAIEKSSEEKKHSQQPKKKKNGKSGSAQSKQNPKRTPATIDMQPSGNAEYRNIRHSSNQNTINENKQNENSNYEHQLNPDVKDALRYFIRKNYHKAISRLIEIVNMEKDPLVKSDCNYWLGESHFGLKQFDKAIIFFIKVVDNVETPKRDDAQIMIAESYVRSGKIDLAKEAFTKLVTMFDKSEYNPRARKMLQQL